MDQLTQRPLSSFTLALLLVLLIQGCGRDAGPAGDDRLSESGSDLSEVVIARVNGSPIVAETFEEAYIRTLIRTGRQDTPEERHRTLQRLIQDQILAGVAEDLGLPQQEMTLLVERTRRKAIADRFYRTRFMDTLAPPTDAQLRTAFYNTKTQVFVRQLYFEADREKEAWEVWKRLEDGESFTDLANEIYATPSYDSLAGSLGAIGYFSVDHAFAEAAYALKPGQYSRPVKTRVGISILMVDARQTQPIITETEFEQKREGITGLVKERILTLNGDRFVRDYMESLQARTDTSHLLQLIQRVRGIETTIPQRVEGEWVLRPKSGASAEDARMLLDGVDGSLPLVHYTVRTPSGPRERVFTAEDYAFWLPTLPLEEVTTRTAASVGRALRNHVFYEAGMRPSRQTKDRHPSQDPYVRQQVRQAELEFKAWWVRQQIATDPTATEDAPVRRAVVEAGRAATIDVDSTAFNSLMHYYQER